MNYEYWLDLAKVQLEAGQTQPTVIITGQFNDWELEQMAVDAGGTIAGSGKVKYTYSRSVKGGQIYNFYLIVNGVMMVDETQKTSSNGKSNWIFVPLSDYNQKKAREIFSKPLSLRMLKLKRIAQAI